MLSTSNYNGAGIYLVLKQSDIRVGLLAPVNGSKMWQARQPWVCNRNTHKIVKIKKGLKLFVLIVNLITLL